METDYVFLTDLKTPNIISSKKADTPKLADIQHLAIPFPAFEELLKERHEEGITQLLRTFPGLEEIVLVVGYRDEVLKQSGGKLEFVEVREQEVLRNGVLMGLCMEVFSPWRAFDHLLGVEMVESAVGRWVEDAVRRRNGGEEWKVPRFRILEVRGVRELTG
jgi:hypothetical protein